ncbi:hypothetical protein quinque_013943 [Culex quinquefasciatus]
MYLANFPLYILKIVRSFLQNRSYHVAVNGHVSDRHEVPFGVPQGAVLSPTLFNLFTADLAMINGIFSDVGIYKDTQFVIYFKV